MSVLEAVQVTKSFHRGAATVDALTGVSLTVAAGESVAVVGASGAGKSTLLHLLGVMDRPTSGSILVEGVDTGTLAEHDLTVLRRRSLGFVFQFFHLLPALSALDNVAVPALLDGISVRHARREARAALEQVGLAGRADHRPAELSGGELQRAAVARALMGGPVAVLADEPTGNLDSATSAEVLGVLRACTTAAGRSLVLVTHDPAVAATCDRTETVEDGALVASVPP